MATKHVLVAISALAVFVGCGEDPTVPAEPDDAAESTPTEAMQATEAGPAEPKTVTSVCKDKPGDVEDGNYKRDPSPPPGMDLTKVMVRTNADGVTVTYESTTPAVQKTPPGIDRLYWNISYGGGNQLLAKLVKSEWTVAQFDFNSGQTNFDVRPDIQGRRMSITYPVELDDSFKWGSNTEYGATNYQDFCPENFKTLRHG